MILSIEEMGNLQKEKRELAQKSIDQLVSHNIFFNKVNILGHWHSIHNNKILKAPIPDDEWPRRDSISDETTYTEY